MPSFTKIIAWGGILLPLSACVAVPAYTPPPGYYNNYAYEYYPGYNYYYGAPYPTYFGLGYYDWGYWHGHSYDHGHWGHYHGRGGHWGHR